LVTYLRRRQAKRFIAGKSFPKAAGGLHAERPAIRSTTASDPDHAYTFGLQRVLDGLGALIDTSGA